MWKQWVKRLLPALVRQKLQQWNLQRQVRGFDRRVVRHRYAGHELSVELADPLAASWYDHDWPVLPEIDLLRTGRLKPGAVVFDIGAHQGVVALMLAGEVGPTGRVVAVEPQPHNHRLALRNRELNDVTWLDVVAAGGAAADGTLCLSRSLNSQTAVASDYAGTFEVAAVCIDSLSEQYGCPDVLFIDVEGMEVEVLRGATTTLSTRPDAFVEVHVGHGLEAAGGTVDRVLSYFPADVYDRSVHTEANPQPMRLADAPASVLADRFFLTAVSRGKKAT